MSHGGNKRQRGFTLIELVIVIALIALTAGVSSDIILSLVRSYAKTSALNEVEQTTNILMTKIEKELKFANSVVTPAIQSPSDTISFLKEENNSLTCVTYFKDNGVLYRAEAPSCTGVDTGIALTDSSSDGILVANDDLFTVVQLNPTVVYVKLSVQQAAGGVLGASIILDQGIVVRGSY